MPSKSWKQHQLMEAAAHDPVFAKAHGIDPAVAADYVAADKKAGLTTKEAFEKKPKKDKPKPKYVEWAKKGK